MATEEELRYKKALEHISKRSPVGYLGSVAREALGVKPNTPTAKQEMKNEVERVAVAASQAYWNAPFEERWLATAKAAITALRAMDREKAATLGIVKQIDAQWSDSPTGT